MAAPEPKNVLQAVDDEAIRLARTLLRTARFGALATLDPETGHPIASRVATATDGDGSPIILISALAAHFAALEADARCSLLLGEPGKGDPLAHARISLACLARRIDAAQAEHERISCRYLNRHPKARLYAGFADFAFFRLDVQSASLNGGFGRAYQMERRHLLVDERLAMAEQDVLEHANLSLPSYCRVTGIDSDGIDLISHDKAIRIFAEIPLGEGPELTRDIDKMVQLYVERDTPRD